MGALQAFARHSYVGRIAIGGCIPVRKPGHGATLAFGSGKTDRYLHDFAYFSSADLFAYWIFIHPPHIDISELDVSHRATIGRVGSAFLGDVLACRRAALIHGDLTIPELDAGHGWRPLGTIGVRCHETNVALECSNKQIKRINPISGSIGRFVFYGRERSGNNDQRIPHTRPYDIKDARPTLGAAQ